jgi:undecaprenyl-diphosphatase
MEMLNRIHHFERRLFTRIFRQGERRAVIPLARALSRSGDVYLYLMVPLLLWLLDVPSLGNFLTLLLVAFAIERTLYRSIKNTLKRPRPPNAIPGFNSLIVASDKFSFPSGHSSGAFLLATALVVVYGGPVLAIYLWAAGVALSRVLLGVHFPGDILAGALMGSSIALTCAALMGFS